MSPEGASGREGGPLELFQLNKGMGMEAIRCRASDKVERSKI